MVRLKRAQSDISRQSCPIKEEIPDRGKWANKTEFLLSTIGYSVGIGNIWRFPYLAYQNGGGAFLFAYVVLLVLIGKPHFFAELGIGQFSGLGTLHVWKCFPLGKGIGFSMVTLSTVVAVYYNVVMMYTLYFMFQSFRSQVPWKECQQWWGADDSCYERTANTTHCMKGLSNLYELNTTSAPMVFNGSTPVSLHDNAMVSCSNGTQPASEQFWEKYVLELTSGIEEQGTLKWDLTLTMFACWTIVALGLIKGIKSSGKVVYFTATFPLVLLVVLMIYGCTLSGAALGIRYFFIPDWKKLLELKVWRAAAEQVLFSLGLGGGGHIIYASYNQFDNTLYSDVLIVSLLDLSASLLSGVVIFSVLGHLSFKMDVEISKVVKGGQGLAFVAYPEALATLPLPQLWSVMFFFMLFLLAIDSQFTKLENFFTCFFDERPHLRSKKMHFTLAFCFVMFLAGLPCLLQGGQYILNLLDKYCGVCGIILAPIEITAIMWGYGANRFVKDMEFMLNRGIGMYWRLCWKYIEPTILWFMLIYSLYTHPKLQYGGKSYPVWATYVGWTLTVLIMIQVPIWGAIQAYRHKKDLKSLVRPHCDWGPSDPKMHGQYFSQQPYKLKDLGEKGTYRSAAIDETRTQQL